MFDLESMKGFSKSKVLLALEKVMTAASMPHKLQITSSFSSLVIDADDIAPITGVRDFFRGTWVESKNSPNLCLGGGIDLFTGRRRRVDATEDQDSNAHMAYWLSNTSVLLFLLQRTLKATGGKPPTPTSFFGRMTQRNDCTITTNGDLIDKIYQSLIFQQLVSGFYFSGAAAIPRVKGKLVEEITP